MISVDPFHRVVKGTSRPRVTLPEVKDFLLYKKIGGMDSLYEVPSKVMSLYSKSASSCADEDSYWLDQATLEFSLRLRLCSKYIGKLRFTSTKISHVSRNNPRKAERVYPTQSEHLAMALDVMRGW
jgi:hypothetical protein